ncbi:hypothetical protein PR048_014096 [Dryococelus australis]|uniref:Uncharacterized protein n=1 Tax=Dryococelus australis TaxID=614101 RepID=A0ABQ9HDF2_9NEOP|nr:hypothetical protein PR048_014096 [Dryococelus australis]
MKEFAKNAKRRAQPDHSTPARSKETEAWREGSSRQSRVQEKAGGTAAEIKELGRTVNDRDFEITAAAPKDGPQRDFEIAVARRRADDLGRNKRIIPRLPANREVTQEKKTSQRSRNPTFRMLSQEGSEVGDQFISVTSAVRHIAQPFNGSKGKLREVLDNVDTAFDLVHPDKHSVLLKFIKSKIVGGKSKLLARERTGTWEDMKEILEENYATRRTIDYYACRLFNARQGTSEGVPNWGSRVDAMVTI